VQLTRPLPSCSTGVMPGQTRACSSNAELMLSLTGQITDLQPLMSPTELITLSNRLHEGHTQHVQRQRECQRHENICTKTAFALQSHTCYQNGRMLCLMTGWREQKQTRLMITMGAATAAAPPEAPRCRSAARGALPPVGRLARPFS